MVMFSRDAVAERGVTGDQHIHFFFEALAKMADKQNRKAALAAWKSQQRTSARSKFPLPEEHLRMMFDAIDHALTHNTCDHILRHVREWCNQNGIESWPIETWLQGNGGYCDCEVLANTEQSFQEACNPRDDVQE